MSNTNSKYTITPENLIEIKGYLMRNLASYLQDVASDLFDGNALEMESEILSLANQIREIKNIQTYKQLIGYIEEYEGFGEEEIVEKYSSWLTTVSPREFIITQGHLRGWECINGSLLPSESIKVREVLD